MRLCNGVHEKINTIWSQKISRLLRILLLGNTIRDASFCDAVINIYDEMVLKIFINTIAKPYVTRLSGSLDWSQSQFYMHKIAIPFLFPRFVFL